MVHNKQENADKHYRSTYWAAKNGKTSSTSKTVGNKEPKTQRNANQLSFSVSLHFCYMFDHAIVGVHVFVLMVVQ